MLMYAVLSCAPLCPSASNIKRLERSGLAFEFAWLPMVMFGGRLGSVLALAKPCVSELVQNVHVKVLAGAIAFSFHLGVDVLQAV